MATTDAHKTEPAEITAAAVASFEGCAGPAPARVDARRSSRHLHAFADEVALTEDGVAQR